MAEWISVKERLPDKDGRYLCYTDTDYGYPIEIASFATNLYEVDEYDFEDEKRAGWYCYDGNWGFNEIEDITHWMPLPDAPQKEIKKRG